MAKKKKLEPTEEVESEEEESEEEDDEEVELLQVEVGDIIKLKQVLDEAVVETFLASNENSNLDFEEDQYWDIPPITSFLLRRLFLIKWYSVIHRNAH